MCFLTLKTQLVPNCGEKEEENLGEKQPKANVTFGWPWRTRISEAVKFDRSLKI